MGIAVKRIFVAGIAALALLAGAAFGGWQWLNSYVETPLLNTSDYELTVEPGSSLRSVLRTLAQDGMLAHPDAVRIHAKVSGTGDRIQAGRYTLSVSTTPQSLLEQLRSGGVDLVQVRIIEGWTAAQAVAAIKRHADIVDDLELEVLSRGDGQPFLDTSAHESLARLLGIEQDSIEGWLYPDTYSFAPGTKASDLLRLLHKKQRSELASAWAGREDRPTLPDPYSLLILASIVEKETSREDERARVAGVFDRRLQRKIRLQTDPTVIYGVGQRYDGDIRRRDLNDQNPYNTYRVDGLPPGPIALPGKAALRASAEPADGTALYFVATGEPDGSHVFSETIEEHESAVRDYLKKLRQRGN
ncbi:MAG: endolytic transglycosylase MltG [Pseudomonadota bacterium]